MIRRLSQIGLMLGAALVLSGCVVGPTYAPPALTLPDAWNAPAPATSAAHDGNPAKLKDWWASWGDPVLAVFIEHAQQENFNVAIAAARIDAARAVAAGVAAPLWPGVGAKASDIRSRSVLASGGFGGGNAATIVSSRSAAVEALWELDLFGGVRRNQEAATARSEARTLDWHDARVSVAAEVAMHYVNLRACEVLSNWYAADAQSRAETARLTHLKVQAGFTAPAEGALSNASAAEAAARLTQQRADCDLEVKALSLVTAMAEPLLRAKLAARTAVFPTPTGWAVERVPANALAQRPDLASSERELAAASADIGVAEADRYPRISLTGSIGYSLGSIAGADSRGHTWSYGPAVSLPIFDAGRRAANVEAAKARYAQALADYKGRTARAVREVEESLVRLHSATQRDADAKAALKGYQAFLKAAEARVSAGAANQVELEEARRAVVAAQSAVVNVERERLTAWVTLYRAVGGGWNEAPAPVNTAAETPNALRQE